MVHGLEASRMVCPRVNTGVLMLSELVDSKAFCLHLESIDEFLAFVDAKSMSDEGHVLLISRLPQRRLLEHVHLDKVESYWLTSQDVAGSIDPKIDLIEDLVKSRVCAHNGIIIIEGIEWLISIHGFSAVQGMVMRLNDSLHRRPWSILYVFDTSILSDVELSRFHKEASIWSIPKQTKVEIFSEEVESPKQEPLLEDETPGLSFLVKLPRQGFSKDLLRRRILQWRRMGLDVSEVEPAMYFADEDKSFDLYKVVELKVRNAIELDNRLDLLLDRGMQSEVTKLRFRVRQLTGFDEVEARIDELI